MVETVTTLLELCSCTATMMAKQAHQVLIYTLGLIFWVTVDFDDSQDSRFYEIIHRATTDSINICLVNKGRGTPFISALLLRPLGNSLYNVSDFASLHSGVRFNTGLVSESDTRSKSYSDDVYNRFWAAIPLNIFPDWVTDNSISKGFSLMRNDEYRVPPSFYKTRAMPMRGKRFLNLTLEICSPAAQVYLYFHFGETDQNLEDNPRAFNICIIGNEPIYKIKPIQLRYLEALTVAAPPIKRGPDSKISILINQTDTSTLPPILNAVEIYCGIELSQSTTNQDDINAIMDVKTKYRANGLMKSWQGDPCLPKLPWDGINCTPSGTDSPRITSLNLASTGFSGEILPSLVSLKSLNYLNLSNNNLRGKIPDFLADMPSLQVIDLSGNKLGGSVPITLMDRVKNGSLMTLRLEGNPDLCTSDTCRERSKKHNIFAPVVAAAASFVLVVAIACAVFYACRRKGKPGSSERFKSIGGMKSKNRKFTRSEVINMTQNFQRIVRTGGFGTVYHGSLNDGTEVAVKILKQPSAVSIESFETEARNLVSLIGYCEEGITMALIYEYMANGDLQERLSGEHTTILSWKERLQISINAAQGLDYLHCGCKPAIFHRDVKPANILLDDKLQAKMADFGMSRIFSTESMSHISTQNVAGTPGYLDPEYSVSFRLTEKSDVYSFGIILLELITGRAVIITRNQDVVHIVNWVAPLLARGDIVKIVDKRIEGDFNTNSAWTALEIAMACVSPAGIQRPSMAQVLAELKESLALELAHEKAREGAHGEAATSTSGQASQNFHVDSNVSKGPTAR